jgi:transposase InsO family protein
MIPPSWSFIVWGLDIMGPFPRAVEWYRYLYVAINKFTKWPKATTVVKINKQSIVRFIKSIVCRFRVPNRIINDNGTQFNSKVFQEYYEDLGIQIYYTSIAHLESNSQVERANAEILMGLRTRTYDCLKKHGAKWIDEFSCTLWVNRTPLSRATGDMPFLLVYRARVVIPPEITMGSSRAQAYDEATQDQLRRDDIDLVDERRWQAVVRNARVTPQNSKFWNVTKIH